MNDIASYVVQNFSEIFSQAAYDLTVFINVV